jgi:membrane protease YdiL (CAAX protease family)
LPLIMTAFIGGLVWGYIYERTGSLLAVIVSHVLFDLLIFVIVPLA